MDVWASAEEHISSEYERMCVCDLLLCERSKLNFCLQEANKMKELNWIELNENLYIVITDLIWLFPTIIIQVTRLLDY